MSPDELSASYAAQRFGGESDASASEPTPSYELADLLADPNALRKPPGIVPRLAWEGRVTMLAAAEKAGKSTLVGQAVAANVSGGEFLGELPARCPVIWLALDEPMDDLVRRLASHGLTSGVTIYDQLPSLAELEATAVAKDAGLVVVDTLLEFAGGSVEDSNSATQWRPVLKALRGIAQRTRAAFIVLHHVNRSTGRYRDSSQLGAGVDQIFEMMEVENDPALRKCRVKGRIQSELFTIRYVNGRYELESGELPLDLRTYRAIESNPGIGVNELRKAIGGKAGLVDDVVARLIAQGTVENRGNQKRHAYYIKPPVVAAGPGLVSVEGHTGSREGHGSGTQSEMQVCPDDQKNDARDTVAPDLVSDVGHTGTQSGHTLGHTTVSRPPIRGGRGHTVVAGSEIPPCSLCGTAQKRTIHNTYRCPKCCPDNRWAA